MDKTVLKEDFMSKRSQMRKKLFATPHFNSRWFQLTPNSLNYYDGDMENGRKNLKGSINLSYVVTVESANGSRLTDKPHILQIGYNFNGNENDFCNLYVVCAHAIQKQQWIESLREACSVRACILRKTYHEGMWTGKHYSCCRNINISSKGCKKCSPDVDEENLGKDSCITEKGKNSLTHHKWYHDNLSKVQAENMLEKDGREGCFLVRISQKKPGLFTLAVLTRVPNENTNDEEEKSNLVLHFHIKRNGSNGYYLSSQRSFGTLAELVHYYECHSGGLPCRLKSYPGNNEEFMAMASGIIGESELQYKEVIGSGQFGVDIQATQ